MLMNRSPVAATMAKTSTYTVAPGDNVGFTIDVAISHPGPLSIWMSKAPEGTAANEYDGSGDWFKVYELTYYEINSEGIQWATVSTFPAIMYPFPGCRISFPSFS